MASRFTSGVAFKPVATVMHEQQTVDINLKNTTLKGRGRHDPCVLPRAVPIVEAMAALASRGPCHAAARAVRLSAANSGIDAIFTFGLESRGGIDTMSTMIGAEVDANCSGGDFRIYQRA